MQAAVARSLPTAQRAHRSCLPAVLALLAGPWPGFSGLLALLLWAALEAAAAGWERLQQQPELLTPLLGGSAWGGGKGGGEEGARRRGRQPWRTSAASAAVWCTCGPH